MTFRKGHSRYDNQVITRKEAYGAKDSRRRNDSAGQKDGSSQNLASG
jgi:hypothetical protein